MWEGLALRLQGRIVALEPLEPRHEEGLWRAAGDPDVWRWMTVNAGVDRDVFGTWFQDALAAARESREAPFAIVAADDGRPVGSSRYLTLRPEHRGLEIGYTWMARETWGKGHNVEAKLLLLEHAFERLGCMRVEFKTEAKNERSRAALAALPAQFEGVFRSHMIVRGGELRDSAYYSVTEDEWPAVKTALLARVEARL
jgi:RimJ/RimL family protein N-acetyltransferase